MAKPRSLRMRKVNKNLREVVADEVADLKDPRLGFVTVTSVDTSPDLRRATVYYSSMGTPEEQDECHAALASAASRIRARVGKQVRLKYLPELEFVTDPSIETGLRISDLLTDAGASSDATGDEEE